MNFGEFWQPLVQAELAGPVQAQKHCSATLETCYLQKLFTSHRDTARLKPLQSLGQRHGEGFWKVRLHFHVHSHSYSSFFHHFFDSYSMLFHWLGPKSAPSVRRMAGTELRMPLAHRR